jgi:hypothetical protein
MAAIPNVFVLDPLTYAANENIKDANFTPNMGGVVPAVTLPAIQRYTFNPLMFVAADNATAIQAKQAAAQAEFYCQDELKFDLPKERSPVPTAPFDAGDRPWRTTDTGNPITGLPLQDTNFSWFLMVSPSSTEAALPLIQRRTFSVAVVVCHKRIVTQTSLGGGNYSPDGETYYTAQCDSADGYGGIGVRLTGDAMGGTPPLKTNQWVLLYGINPTTNAITQATWYRVVHAGLDSSNTRLTLVGPDWHGGGNGAMGNAIVVVVDGVTGVYTTTVQLDNDLIWNQ